MEQKCLEHNLPFTHFCIQDKKNLCPGCIDTHNRDHSFKTFNAWKIILEKQTIDVENAKQTLEEITNTKKKRIAEMIKKIKSKEDAELVFENIRKIKRVICKKLLAANASSATEKNLEGVYQDVLQEKIKMKKELQEFSELKKMLEQRNGTALSSTFANYDDYVKRNTFLLNYCQSAGNDLKIDHLSENVEDHLKERKGIYEKVIEATKDFERAIQKIFGASVEEPFELLTISNKEEEKTSVNSYNLL